MTGDVMVVSYRIVNEPKLVRAKNSNWKQNICSHITYFTVQTQNFLTMHSSSIDAVFWLCSEKYYFWIFVSGDLHRFQEDQNLIFNGFLG